jgi:hypothetical protein
MPPQLTHCPWCGSKWPDAVDQARKETVDILVDQCLNIFHGSRSETRDIVERAFESGTHFKDAMDKVKRDKEKQ